LASALAVGLRCAAAQPAPTPAPHADRTHDVTARILAAGILLFIALCFCVLPRFFDPAGTHAEPWTPAPLKRKPFVTKLARRMIANKEKELAAAEKAYKAARGSEGKRKSDARALVVKKKVELATVKKAVKQAAEKAALGGAAKRGCDVANKRAPGTYDSSAEYKKDADVEMGAASFSSSGGRGGPQGASQGGESNPSSVVGAPRPVPWPDPIDRSSGSGSSGQLITTHGATLSGGGGTDWCVFERTNVFPGENWPKARRGSPYSGRPHSLAAAREKCMAKGMGGFVVFQGRAYFRKHPPSELLHEAKTGGGGQAGLHPEFTLHVAPVAGWRPEGEGKGQRRRRTRAAAKRGP